MTQPSAPSADPLFNIPPFASLHSLLSIVAASVILCVVSLLNIFAFVWQYQFANVILLISF